jgi:hypothetical protein
MLGDLHLVEDVQHAEPARLERIRNHLAMALPPQRFGAHDGRSPFRGC